MLRGYFLTASLLFVSSILVGCGGGGPDLPDIAPVEGVVTLDGQPLANVVVGFEPVEGGRASIGKTDDSGHYVLSYDDENKGAVVGQHKVSVTTPSEAPDPSGVEKDPIPAKYNVKSELKKDVTADSNTINLELTTK